MLIPLSMRVIFFVPIGFLYSCPTASCSFWFLSHMKLGAVASSSVGGDTAALARQKARVMCDLIPGLSRRQKRLCDAHPAIMRTVFQGVQIGVGECQLQFKNQRWNCTTVSRGGRGIGKILLKLGSREAAFVYAVSSAGVVHSIARKCASGSLPECACDNTRRGIGRDKKGEFIWGGCSDNFRYAARFSRRFIDSTDKRSRDPMALMNLHNSRAGRKAVLKSLTRACKCHGVSGSCTTRTCWRSVGEFHNVGRFLHEKYEEATEVRTHQNGEGLIAVSNIRSGGSEPTLGFIRYDSVLSSPKNRNHLEKVKHYLASKTVRGHRSKQPSRDYPPQTRQFGNSQQKRRQLQQQTRIHKADLVFFEPSPDYCVTNPKTGEWS